MTQLVHERVLELRDGQGTAYRRAFVYADRQPLGTWVAWVEFVSANGDKVLQTDRETTQRTLRGLSYWAASLQPTYFEQALGRAYRRVEAAPSAARTASMTNGGLVAFRVRTADPGVAFRLIPTRTLFPGNRWQLHEGGAIIYVRVVEPAPIEMPRVYEFLAQFRSDTAAEALADRLEGNLRGTDARLEIRRVEVPIEGAAIREALLAPN